MSKSTKGMKVFLRGIVRVESMSINKQNKIEQRWEERGEDLKIGWMQI